MAPVLIVPTSLEPDSDGKFLVPHFVEDQDLADLIIQDLAERYPSTSAQISDICPDKLFWDAGGAIRTFWEPDDAGPIRFWPHQVDSFLSKLNSKLSDVRDLQGVRYCKISTCNGLMCVRESTLLAARTDILARWSQISAKRDADLASWDDAMNYLREEPHPNILLPEPADPKNVN
jgi:hypothetical protein